MNTLTRNVVGNRLRSQLLATDTLLSNVRIHGHEGHFLRIVDGTIRSISTVRPSDFNGDELTFEGAVIVPGAIDLHTSIREPGREDIETLETAALAAANGGFVQITMLPDDSPKLDSAEIVQHITQRATQFLTQINVVGALTIGREGRSIAPFAELAEEGAVAFSDGRTHIRSATLMHTALTYIKMLQRPVIVKAADSDLNDGGQMHEGFQSTRLGFNGMPTIAEEIIISRDLMIAEYVGGRIHFATISSSGSVELIRQAKAKGVNVTCDVAVHNLIYTDKVMERFDTNFKLDPPLRSAEHRDALIEGLKDGTIDAISSAHEPRTWEDKEAEFLYAPFGAVSLETMIPLLLDRFIHTGIFSINELIKWISTNPSTILNQSEPIIAEGQPASITIIEPDTEYTVDKQLFLSKSNNTPYHGETLKGFVRGTISNGMRFIKS